VFSVYDKFFQCFLCRTLTAVFSHQTTNCGVVLSPEGHMSVYFVSPYYYFCRIACIDIFDNHFRKVVSSNIPLGPPPPTPPWHETTAPTPQKPPLQFPVIKSSNKAPDIDDETLPKKRGKYKEQNGRTQSPRRQKKPPKKGNHPRNIKFPNPLLSQEAYLNKEREKIIHSF